MKAFILSLALLFTPLSIGMGDSVYVLSNSCYLYEEPSYASVQLTELKYNEELVLLNEEAIEGFFYVELVKDGLKGYVPMEIVGEKAQAQDVIMTYNATVLNDTTIKSPVDNSEICTLEKGARVFLYEGYDKEKEFLAVKFIKDGEIFIGLININDVKPDGVNVALIISITAIVALVTIIFILIGITNKKRHKTLKF